MTRAEQAARRRARDPYRALVAAILHQAVLDVRSRQLAWNDGGPDARCTVAAALAYVHGCQDLTDLCELAGCDADLIQRALLTACLPEVADSPPPHSSPRRGEGQGGGNAP